MADPSGAVVPHAVITAVNVDTGFRRSAISGPDGAYTFALLDPGSYRLDVAAEGFRNLIRGPIAVHVSETVSVLLLLEVGSSSDQAVFVTARGSALQSASPTLGTVFGPNQVRGLPLVTRNYTQLLSLEPGVLAELPNSAAFGNGTQGMSVSGGRYYDNSVLLDGINATGSITNGYTGLGPGAMGGVAVPAPDSVQEFKVQTNLYSAEYGRAGGSSVNLIARSGTNALHGDAYEFFRNERLNANDFFFKKAQSEHGSANVPPLLRENQFGGTLGGPVRKNRVFFFGSYQGTRQLNAAAPGLVQFLNRYPLLPEDRSDAQAFRKELGAIYGGRAGFLGKVAGNTIAADGSNISEVAMNLLRAKLPDNGYVFPSFPAGTFNDGAGGRGGGAVYADASFSFPSVFREDQFSANFDSVLTPRQMLSARWFFADQRSRLPSGNVPGFTQVLKPRNRNLAVAHSYSPGPTLVNEFRAGYTRIANGAAEQDPLGAADIGMKPAPGSPRLPQIALAASGLTVNSAQGSSRDAEDMYTLSDTVSKIAGAHSIRFGGSAVRHRLYTNSDLLKAGQLIIVNFEDFLLGDTGSGNGTGISNLLASAAQTGSFEKLYRLNDLSFFVQDDWRAARNLTVNLGLRYDYFSWPVEMNGRLGNFDARRMEEGPFGIPPGNRSYSGYVVAENFRDHFPGVAIPQGVATASKTTLNGADLNNFGPRIGLAWQPAPSVVLRAGYGIFHPRVNAELANAMAFGYPFNSLVQTSFSSAGSLADPFSHLRLPPDGAFPQWAPRIYDPNAVAAPLLAPVDAGVRNPYVQQWNASIQREIAKDLVLEAAYVGSHGLRLVNTRAGNTPAVASPAQPIRGVVTNTTAPANIQSRSPVAGILADRGLALTTTDAESKYNAAWLSARQRLKHGLLFLSALTIGKAIDNNSLTPTGSVSNAQTPGDNRNLQHYGLSAFDRTYRWANSYAYQLPNPWKSRRVWGGITGGWTCSGVLIFQSGLPITFAVQQTGSAVKLQGFLTPDLQPGKTLGDIRGSGPVAGRLDHYFASPRLGQPGTVFAAPATLSFGGLGRGLNVRTPGQRSFDAALSKRAALSENVALNLRGELYNAFNWTNFGAPSANVSISGFGTITSTTTAPRVVQIAIKLEF